MALILPVSDGSGIIHPCQMTQPRNATSFIATTVIYGLIVKPNLHIVSNNVFSPVKCLSRFV